MSFIVEFQNREGLSLNTPQQNATLPWLEQTKLNALQAFKSAPLPSRKVEHWKYNDLSFLASNFEVNQQKPNLSKQALTEIEFAKYPVEPLKLEDAIEITFINGLLATETESLNLGDSLQMTKFSNANEEQQAIIKAQLEHDLSSKNLLLNLNQALINDGLLIQLNDNALQSPVIHIKHYTHGEEQQNIHTCKVILCIGESSQATLVEQFFSKTEAHTQLALQQTSIAQKQNSHLKHFRINLESASATQVSQVKSQLADNCVMDSFYLSFGSRLNRTDIDVMHQGKNAQCNITGIYLPAHSNTVDYHSNIEHQIPHCNTNEVFRGIIADESSATFNGKIHIFKDAQKSDAQLNNKNLLLTNRAEINTKPELEIYADDVVCAHGATVAQIDNKALYYLQSRGIKKAKAEKMLSLAFIQELLNSVKDKAINDYLNALVDSHMSSID
ncbi:Fe-S cluster assembly protein SufD [Aliikangiella sp. IMCC44653]